MSFVAEVVNEATKIEYKEAVEKLSKLEAEIDNTKQEIFTYFQEIYVEHLACKKIRNDFHRKVLNYHTEIEVLSKILKNAKKRNIDGVRKRLSCMKNCHNRVLFLSNVCQIHNQFILFQTAVKNKKYDEAIETLSNLNFNDTYYEEFSRVLVEMKRCITFRKTKFVMELNEIFFKNMFLKYDKITILKINKYKNDEEKTLSKLIPFFIDQNILYNFVSEVISLIIEPLTRQSYQIEITEDEKCNRLKMVELEMPLVYTELYSAQLKVFKFFADVLSVPKNNNQTIYKYLLEYIKHDVWNLILKHHKENTIPNLANGTLILDEVLRKTEDFQNSLTRYDILESEKYSIVNYLKNWAVISSYQKHGTYFKTIQHIMETNFNTTETVKIIFDTEQQCKISKSAIVLVEFLKDICSQVKSESDAHLLKIVKNAISSYGIVVQEYHKRILSECPKSAAIFHNNCFYICEKAAGILNSQELHVILKDKSFFEDIHRLRVTAVRYFLKIIEEQKTKIVATLSCKIRSKDKGRPENIALETTIRVKSCFKQIEELKNSWDDVLPSYFSRKAIGQIVNSFCDEFINSVMGFVEFSSDASEYLHDLLNIVVQFGNQVFDEEEIVKLVPTWKKIEELVMMNESTLCELEAKLLGGTGRMGLLFEYVEIKMLIKIMFPDDSNRQTLIEKIPC